MPVHDLGHCALQPDRLVIVAVSGGPDSLALLHFLHTQKIPLLVASFNHQLRVDAAEDIKHVQGFAAQLGLPFVSGSGDVAAYAADHTLSIEEAARELRYQFLFQQARQSAAQAVAVGHTADDQAETVLMHFLRGAGLSGLKGMPSRVRLPVFDPEIPLVRPLLAWTRAETEDYCHLHDLRPHFDPSNTDTRFLRNRLRHELLPLLESYNPQIRLSLTRTALALQGDYELLNEIIESSWQKTVQSSGSGYVEFNRAELAKLNPVLIRNLFRRAAFSLKPGLRDVDFEALERAASLKAVDIAGGLKTVLEGSHVYLTESEDALPAAEWPQIQVSLPLHAGSFALENGWRLDIHEVNSANLLEQSRSAPDRFTAWLDADLAAAGLHIRAYQSGDRFEPLGMARQTVKVAELFINLKIPKRVRTHWPLVCVNTVIAWVPGLRFAEPFKLTPNTTRAWKLELNK